MSLRSFRIFTKTLATGAYSVILESLHTAKFLLIQSGALLNIDNEVGNNLKKSYIKLTDGYGLMGILRLSEGNSYLILISGVLSVGQLYNCDVYKITNVQFVPLDREITDIQDSRIIDLQRLLSAGIFYYAYSNDTRNLFNLTLSSQKRYQENSTDFRFFWNRNLGFSFDRYDIRNEEWLVQCMCGSVLIRTIYVGHRTAKVAIISRLSCERVGTRFNVRGVNDDGNVANFVETEQLITFEDQESSYIQIRGSIPLYWEQPGINVGSHKVKIKSIELSMLPLERHYGQLKNFYGNVYNVNLLGSKEGERLLSNAFQTALKASSQSDVPIISFDYHAQLKQSKDFIKYLLKDLFPIVEECLFFQRNGENILRYQRGVIRTNCLDCLDRTNSVQTLIGIRALNLQMASLELDKYKANISIRFEEILKDLWQKNGDQCSIIYAGTGALEGKSKLKDASRSIARTIQNNLMDSSKQESFDLLLLGCTFGNKIFDKVSNLLPAKVIRDNFYFYECPAEVEAFVDREQEICVVERLSIFVGTWNVNGGKNMYNVAFRHEQSLDSWIFPADILKNISTSYDVIAIGLEEIVDLNASNMMKASTTNQRVWRDGIKNAINHFYTNNTLIPHNNDKYSVLACEQLVGVCLILFVKANLLAKIRDLAVGEVKTGMGGATGNKGSVVVRLTINSTSICFVCSHFAAGQNEVFNRNEDFQTALRKIRFPLGRTITSHDVIFWLGDFNYRISLSGDEVKNAVKAQNFNYLIKHDQLTQQKEAGNIFQNFQEGPLNFAPTYKYDTFSDDYDTSEKCRAPAWTDRVLWSDSRGLTRLSYYGRSELKTSDHRPVMGVYEVDSLKVDLKKCQEIISDVVFSMGPPNATILCSISNNTEGLFPPEFCQFVFEKLQELSISILVYKIEDQFLHIVLASGVEALASLSMDQVQLGNGEKLSVALKNPDWASSYSKRLEILFEEANKCASTITNYSQNWAAVNINSDDEDDDDGFKSTNSDLVASRRGSDDKISLKDDNLNYLK